MIATDVTAEEAGAEDVGAAGDCTTTPGAKEARPVSPTEFALSQCHRAFRAPDFINLIIERCYMNLHCSVAPVC